MSLPNDFYVAVLQQYGLVLFNICNLES